MKYFIPLLFIVSAHTQNLYESFETFDKDSKNWYVAKTTYEFDVSKAEENNRVVEFSNVVGDISVEGKPTSTVTIIEKIKIRSKTKSYAQEIFQSSKAEVSKSGLGHIQFKMDKKFRSRYKVYYDYDIVVPNHYNLSLRTSGGDVEVFYLTGEAFLKTSGGDIDVTTLTGRLTAKTSGGDLTLEKVKGVANIRTSGGDIEISDCIGKLEGTTSGGDVDVSFCQAEVDMHTSGGNIDFKDITGKNIYGRTSGGNIEVEDVKGDVEVYTSGGNIEVVNLDGHLECETSGGHIDLERVQGNIDVKTSGGTIKGDRIHGKIYARTSGGSVKIEKIWDQSLKNHDINLRTSDGSIELILPEDFPASFDAFVDNPRSTSVIDSEFPIQIRLNDGDVIATGDINGGTFIVKLKSRRGSITIEKD
ncbi:MAG: DUF4097 family beta strand repeat protein [Candidatus Marinimicrobia bacterium]|nr:DUF4097 family beta strand repeat protein [Candidatus Neomarinimicrobiota bacterium]MBL7031270.1 DUF4097 family beta strand repeat protein [Candidatus Neomarinimicrobiota bacterium]